MTRTDGPDSRAARLTHPKAGATGNAARIVALATRRRVQVHSKQGALAMCHKWLTQLHQLLVNARENLQRLRVGKAQGSTANQKEEPRFL
jgi:hypothetical protein